jgi:hypothetical protein
MKSMYIGSGDVGFLLSGLHTKLHGKLLQRFVSNTKPYYNSEASPIDALRTGAILEKRYLLLLPDNYFPQYVCVSTEMDVFRCSLDFAKIENGKVVDFQELKTCSLTDYLEFEFIKNENSKLVEYVKKKYKKYYTQVQHQLFCTNLDEADMVFLSVTSYDDEVNNKRDILENEYLKIRISRDEEVINLIKDRGRIFQKIKDIYNSSN